MSGLILDERFIGDFGTCKVCGKKYQIYGSNHLCDECRIDEWWNAPKVKKLTLWMEEKK